MPQHCIYWRLLFTKAHDRSSDTRKKSHPLLIQRQASGAWRAFIKKPQHGATARLSFFFLSSSSQVTPPPGRGRGERLAEVTLRAEELQ